MLVYILFYLVIILLGGLFSRKRNQARSKRWFCNIVFILMCIIMGFRDISVGEDTAHYVEWFNDYCAIPKITSPFHPSKDVEIGYSIINIILSRITHDPRILILTISVIVAWLHINFIRRNSKNVYLSVELYIALNFFFTSMNSWRQFIAMGIGFWMFPLLLKKKYLKAIITLLIAFCFHDTVLVFGIALFVVFLLNRKKNRLMTTIILLACSLAAASPMIKLFLYILPAYAEYFKGASGSYFGELEIVFIVLQVVLISLVLKNKALFNDKRITLMAALLACNIAVTFFGLFIPHIFRLNYYFKYFIILIIPEILYRLVQNKSSILYVKPIKNITFVCCCLLFGYYVSINPGNVVPYRIYGYLRT